jgi:hypothetical protein
MQSDSVSGFDTVHFAIRFDDALDLRNIRLPAGWNILDSSAKHGSLDLWIVSNSQPLPSQLLVLSFGTALARRFARVYLDSIHFFSPPAICGDNTLSLAAPDSVEIDFEGCGDSTLLRFMATGSPFEIESVTPNPARDEISVHFSRSSKAPVTYTLFDALGVNKLRGEAEASDILFDVSLLPSGVYYLRIAQSDYVQTRRIVIAR